MFIEPIIQIHSVIEYLNHFTTLKCWNGGQTVAYLIFSSFHRFLLIFFIFCWKNTISSLNFFIGFYVMILEMIMNKFRHKPFLLQRLWCLAKFQSILTGLLLRLHIYDFSIQCLYLFVVRKVLIACVDIVHAS